MYVCLSVIDYNQGFDRFSSSCDTDCWEFLRNDGRTKVITEDANVEGMNLTGSRLPSSRARGPPPVDASFCEKRVNPNFVRTRDPSQFNPLFVFECVCVEYFKLKSTGMCTYIYPSFGDDRQDWTSEKTIIGVVVGIIGILVCIACCMRFCR